MTLEQRRQLVMEGLPKKVLWWGVALATAGAVLILLVPLLLTNLFLGTGSSGEGQTAAVALEFAIRVVREIVPPLGTALIGASLVMGFIQARHEGPEGEA